VKVKPRDSYQLGATIEDDDELYPQCMPPNTSKEEAFRDPDNRTIVNCEE